MLRNRDDLLSVAGQLATPALTARYLDRSAQLAMEVLQADLR